MTGFFPTQTDPNKAMKVRQSARHRDLQFCSWVIWTHHRTTCVAEGPGVQVNIGDFQGLAGRFIPKAYFRIVYSYQGSWHGSHRALNIPKGGTCNHISSHKA